MRPFLAVLAAVEYFCASAGCGIADVKRLIIARVVDATRALAGYKKNAARLRWGGAWHVIQHAIKPHANAPCASASSADTIGPVPFKVNTLSGMLPCSSGSGSVSHGPTSSGCITRKA